MRRKTTEPREAYNDSKAAPQEVAAIPQEVIPEGQGAQEEEQASALGITPMRAVPLPRYADNASWDEEGMALGQAVPPRPVDVAVPATRHPKADEPPKHPGMPISRNKPNELKVIYDHTMDDCANLNPTWKRGCCMAQGHVPCAFLGGNQEQCELYKSREAVLAERANTDRRRWRNE